MKARTKTFSILIVGGLAFATIASFMSPNGETLNGAMAACREAIAKSKLEVEATEAVKACLAKADGPFVVEVEVEATEGSYRVSRLKNFDLFTSPAVSRCITQTVNRKTTTVHSMFKALPVSIEFTRLTRRGEIGSHSKASCAYSSNPFRNENTSIARDYLYLKDSPLEQDESFKAFQICNRLIPTPFKNELEIGSIRTMYASKEGKVVVSFTEVDFPRLPKTFNTCMSKAFLSLKKTAISSSPTVTVNGQNASLATSWVVHEWIARKPKGPLSLYYDWEKMGELERIAEK